MASKFIVIAAVLLSSSVAFIHSTTGSKCPTYCSCTEVVMDCEDGYEGMDDETFGMMSRELENITIHNFIIRELNSKYLQWFYHIKYLALTDSKLAIVGENSFNKLVQLEYINLAGNFITELSSKLFSHQRNVTTLNLSDNLIEYLPEVIFQNITKVSTLSLSGNRIRLIPARLFNNLVNLKHLDLSRNEIAYILPSTFNFISAVRCINLNDNLLVTIHEDLFDSNNVTVLTNLSLSSNPLDCNCGLVWLRRALLKEFLHINLVNPEEVVCTYPRLYHGQMLSDVPLEQLNCSKPEVVTKDSQLALIHGKKFKLECHAEGSPYPSIVWKTPLVDYISDPYAGEWLDGSIETTYPERKYRIYATGEIITFMIETFPGYSVLSVDGLHLVSSGEYECIAISPGGNATASTNVTVLSPIEPFFYPSLVVGAITVLVTIVLGVIGCSVTACIERCMCCESMRIKYYDGAWMLSCKTQDSDDEPQHNNNAESDEEEENDSDVENALEDGELLGAYAADNFSAEHEPSTSSSSLSAHSRVYPTEINEHTALTAEEWDSYFREYPDDFIVESFDGSPRKLGSPRSSPTHRSHGKTLETLEGVRVRLKLRVEQIDVMKERLRIHMEKRSARMKENLERGKMRMNKRMQTIKETTSQSLQSIRETGRSYSHKLHMGVRTAMENVGAQVLSLKEFCGTGDLGQTLSIATITTDIDTNEKTEIARSVTMV